MTACRTHWSAHHQGTVSNSVAGMAGVLVGLALLPILCWLAALVVVAGAALLLITGLRTLLWRRVFREARKYHDDICVTFEDEGIRVQSAEGENDINLCV